MAEPGSASLKRLRSSLPSPREEDYPNKIRETGEVPELTEGWEQTLQAEAAEHVKEDAEEEAKFSGLMRLEDLDERIKNVLAAITSKNPHDGLVEFKKLLQGDDGGNLLQQYVLLSAKFTEIMSVWSSGPSAKYAVPLLQLLCELMRHPMGKADFLDESQHKTASRQLLQVVRLRIDRLARSIVSTKLKDIYAHLTSGERSRQRAALLLMASIIKRGSMLASEVASAFDFKLNVLPSLAKANRSSNDKKGGTKQSFFKHSIRSAFIEFALSFLEVCHASLLRWVLQIRPLYSGVLHKLASDDEATILTVLKVFQLRVLDSSAMVPPGLQSAVFGDSTLEQLAIISSNSLYSEAAQVAHDTLLQLCTDPSHGICLETNLLWGAFPGKTGASGGGQGRLVRLMIKLRATEVQNHRDLLLSIAAGRPVLVATYLESFPYSLEPRVSTAWFAAAALISDILLVAKVLPPFESLATQGLPPPPIDSALLQGILRSALPRNLSRLVINRGLLHANILVKHGCLRMLLEVVSAVEFYLLSISRARRGLLQNVNGESSQIGLGAIMAKKLENFDAFLNEESSIFGTESAHDSVQQSKKEDCCQQWLALQEYFQNELRSFSPDPQVLFSLLSTKPVNIGDASGFKKKRRFSKDSSDVLILDEDLLEREGLLAHVAVSPLGDNANNHAEHEEEHVANLVDIWNADSDLIQSGDLEDIEVFLSAKLLEVLAIYQRIVPMALVESSFDVFKILPEDPASLTLSQQKALLMLLTAASGEPFGQALSSKVQVGIENLHLRHLYRHLKPLLKFMLGSKVGCSRKQAQSLACRAMISSGAFESSNSEVEIWLHFLSLSDNVVLFFFCDAVETVGRNIDKYVDTLLSIIHSAAKQDGLLAPQFGPLVVCVLDKCLRVLASSTKNLKIPETTSIALFVANALDLLLQSQVHPRALSTVIDALLSSKIGGLSVNESSFSSEWSPLQNLLSCAKRHLRGVNEAPSLVAAFTLPQNFPSSGCLAKVLKLCKDDGRSSYEAKVSALSSCLKCTPLHELAENLPLLMEIFFSVCKGKLPVLMGLFGAYKWLLSAVAKLWPELFEKSLDSASSLARSKRATVENLSLSGGQKEASMVVTPALTSKENQLSTASSDMTSFAFSVFLLGLPFTIIFPAAVNFNEAELLRSHQSLSILQLALFDVPPQLWLSTANLIMFWVKELRSLHCQGSDVKCQLEVCFSLLKSLILPSEGHGWYAFLRMEENACAELDLIAEFIRGLLSHPIMNSQFSAADSSLCKAPIYLEEKKFRSMAECQVLESWFNRGLQDLSLVDCHTVGIFKELLQWACERPNDDLSAALIKVQKVVLVSCKPFLNKIFHAVKKLVVENQKQKLGVISPSVLTYMVFTFSPFIDIESMVDLSCTLLSEEHISQEVNDRDVLSLRMPYHIVGLYFATSTFKRVGLLIEEKDSQLHNVLQDSLLQNLYEKVVHMVLTRPSEMAFSCLLSALEAHCNYKCLSFDGWLHKSSTAVLSSCIYTTPMELFSHLMTNIDQVKAKILLHLIQSSQAYLAEFSGVLICNLGIKNVHFRSLTSLVLGQPLSCPGHGKSIYSLKQMMLLLPSVNWLINGIQYEAKHRRIVEEIVLVYSKVIREMAMDWDIFAADLDMPEVIPFLKTDENGENFARLFGLTTPGQIIVMLKHCLAHDSFSVIQKVELLSSLLGKTSPLLDSSIRDVSKLSLECTLKLASVIMAKSMMARLLILPKANSEIGKSIDNSSIDFAGATLMEKEDISAKSLEVANVLVSTLGVLFKQGTFGDKEVQGNESILDVSGFQVKISKLKLLNFVETALFKALKDVLKTTASIQHEAQFMSMLKKITKMVLRFRFGEKLPMQVLRCYALRMVHSSELSRWYAAYALDLLVGHSQFTSTLLSSGAISKLSLVVKRCNGNDTSLRSLSSIVSLLKSPWRQCLMDKFTDPKMANGSEVHGRNSGEGKKLELIRFLRLLYFLKCQVSAVEVSTEQSLNSNELLCLLLAAYGASLSEVDKECLLLMREIESFEGAGFAGLKGMDYLWGEAALKLWQTNIKDVDGSAANKFSDQDTSKEVHKRCFKEDLMLDPFKCALSVLFFPVRRNLFNAATVYSREYEEEERVHHITESDERVLKEAGYDPCFMLPFALQNLSSGWISAEDFVIKGLLALTLVSIASAEDDMRKLGYKVLANFLTLVEDGPSFKGKPQIRLLLTFVKNSILEPWQRLPFVTALFAAEASCILMNPSDVHYPAVNKFLFRAPGIDLEAIPLFKPMFGSGSVYFRADRAWIMRLLAFSLRTSFDTHIYRRRFIVEILMSFYGSPLGDRHTREWTLQILHRASKLRSLVQYLVEHAGLLSWLVLIVCSNGTAKSGEYAGGVSIELALEALQIFENTLMWRSVKRWLISEGFEELSKMVMLLHCSMLQSSSFSEPAMFVRPYLRILGTAFSLSQARKKFQSQLNFSLADFDEIIHLAEMEKAPTYETRSLALRSILESQPPACVSFQEKIYLQKFGTWALSVVLRDFRVLPYSLEENSNANLKKNFTDSKSKFGLDDLIATLIRWLAASLILGELQKDVNCHGPRTAWTFLRRVTIIDDGTSASESKVNKDLVRLLIHLQCLSGTAMATASMVSAVCACILLLPSIDGSCGDFFKKFQDVVQWPLQHISPPLEVDTSWRWRLLMNDMKIQSSLERETCQMLFFLFQKLVYLEKNAELHNMVEMLHLNLRNYVDSQGPFGSTYPEETMLQLWTHLKELFNSPDCVVQRPSLECNLN